jgi:hypothetical protein
MLIVDSKNEVLHKENHVALIPPDDGKAITFNWHFPIGRLEAKMSALELAYFTLQHMNDVIACGLFLDHHPRVQDQFVRMFLKLAMTPKVYVDDALSWIRVEKGEFDDIIYMDISDTTTDQKSTKVSNIQVDAEPKKKVRSELLISLWQQMILERQQFERIYRAKNPGCQRYTNMNPLTTLGPVAYEDTAFWEVPVGIANRLEEVRQLC